VFIETNIRRVYIHFFFDGREHVRDNEIIPVLEETMDRKNPRDWYYALMDYGVKLKKEVKNPNRRSAHYQKQSVFHGSTRQVRGMILRALLKTPGMTKDALRKKMHAAPENVDQILGSLLKENFIVRTGRRYFIP
jgi:A/G-specific adenine glycosylase